MIWIWVSFFLITAVLGVSCLRALRQDSVEVNARLRHYQLRAESAQTDHALYGLTEEIKTYVATKCFHKQHTLTARDNQQRYDNMVKTISQSAQVSEKEAKTITNIILGQAEARASKGGSLMTAVSESVPNVSISTLQNLQNTLTAARADWTMKQTELLNLHAEHTKRYTVFPSSLWLGLFGRQPIPESDIAIISSTRARNAMETGVDDNDKVF